MDKLRIPVGDHGYVHLKDWMGTDLSPVNDAKVSFDKESTELGCNCLELSYVFCLCNEREGNLPCGF